MEKNKTMKSKLEQLKAEHDHKMLHQEWQEFLKEFGLNLKPVEKSSGEKLKDLVEVYECRKQRLSSFKKGQELFKKVERLSAMRKRKEQRAGNILREDAEKIVAELRKLAGK